MDQTTSERAHESGGDRRPAPVDEAPEARPGVPMETAPMPDPDASWDAPARQRRDPAHFHHRGLSGLTPVYGTAQPPRGVSGAIRRAAYRYPEHRARHWMLLLMADRIDVLEDRIGEATGAAEAVDRMTSPVRDRPLRSALLALGAGYLLGRLAR